jgi:hypothetical protein
MGAHIQWLPIFLSAIASGLLSLVISHAYYRITVRHAEMHHDAQLGSAEQRHAEQMKQMEKHHAEQVLVLRTALLAIEKDSGVLAARDREGNLIGGVHHEGEFTAVPDVSPSVIKDTTSKQESAAELQDESESRDRESPEDTRSATHKSGP